MQAAARTRVSRRECSRRTCSEMGLLGVAMRLPVLMRRQDNGGRIFSGGQRALIAVLHECSLCMEVVGKCMDPKRLPMTC